MTRRLLLLAGLAAYLLAPAPVLAHGLLGRVESPLPLAVYLTGAALAVGLSFLLVLARDIAPPGDQLGPPRLVPTWLSGSLRAIGLIGWTWIMAQLVVGGTSAADVSTLFLWVYGWVGIAILSAFLGPVWHWVDPFSTLHDLGAGLLRRAGVTPWATADYPAWLGRWPAALWFFVIVWLELAVRPGPATLSVVVVAYTVIALLGMAQFGRDAWRVNGEVFGVWFGLIGRLALIGPPDEQNQVRRRAFARGLLDRGWSRADVAIVAMGVGSILYDGLSQTQPWFDLFGLPGLPLATVQLVGFLGLVIVLALAVARLVGVDATGAGLVPIAVGYLVAHYLTFLLGDGQRLIVAISDPFQLGWDLFGTAFYEPGTDWIPPVLVWAVQLAAVVCGHIVGAWVGHIVASRDANPRRDMRLRQVPLAILMVGLTTTTLWSLGQVIVKEPAQAAAPAVTEVPR